MIEAAHQALSHTVVVASSRQRGNAMTLEQTTGVLLIVLPVAFNLFFFLLGRMFGYPGLDIENKCWLILGKYNLDMLVLTCGINGSYVFTRGTMSYQPTPKVK